MNEIKIYNKASLGVILTAASLTVMSGAIIAPVLNLMGEGFKVEPGAARLIITIHAIFIALFSPIVGILIDKIGAKKPFVLGLIFFGISGAAGLIINSYWVMILSRVFFGITVAAVFTSITVLILNMYEGTGINKVMGWRGSSNNIGGVIWPLVGGLLGSLSWRLPFATYLIGIPLGILALFTLPELQKDKIKDTDDTSKKMSIIQVLRDTPILYIIYGLMFLENVLLYTLVIFLPNLLDTVGISSPFHIGLLISIMGLAAGLTSLMYGRIKERLSYKTITVISLALWTAAFTIMSQTSTEWMMWLPMALFGIGLGLIFPAVLVWAGEVVPFSFRGRISSYLATFGFIGQFLSPLIFTPVATFLGLSSVFLVAGMACAILFTIFLIFMKK